MIHEQSTFDFSSLVDAIRQVHESCVLKALYTPQIGLQNSHNSLYLREVDFSE